MKFWKMNGAGNDFILINNIEERIPHEKFPEIVKILCERHLSIGADGFMFVEKPAPGSNADFCMLYYNADGSLGEMCGNGARCVARYGYETGLSGKNQVIQTTAGIITVSRINENLYRVRLNDPSVIKEDMVFELGLPSYLKHEALSGMDPAGKECAPGYSAKENTGRITITGSYVELGDPGIPHLVVEYRDGLADICKSKSISGADRGILKYLGRALRYHSSLPKGANISFVEITGADDADIITYERGVEDFTYACGTGIGSAAVILLLKEKLKGSDMRFTARGGTLRVEIEEVREYTDGSVKISGLMLTGPAAAVAKGEITDPAVLKILEGAI